jgi:hypothetical protein
MGCCRRTWERLQKKMGEFGLEKLGGMRKVEVEDEGDQEERVEYIAPGSLGEMKMDEKESIDEGLENASHYYNTTTTTTNILTLTIYSSYFRGFHVFRRVQLSRFF